MKTQFDPNIRVTLVYSANTAGYIGNNQQLMYKIPADLARFKTITKDGIVIMGRKTWDSLPFRPLPERVNWILTRDPSKGFIHAEFFTDIYQALSQVLPGDPVFVIGGGTVLEQAVPFADKIMLTRIHDDAIGDTRAPDLNLSEWEVDNSSQIHEYSGYHYQFIDYKRKLT